MKQFFSTLRFLLVAVTIVCVQCTDMGGGGTIETTNGLVTGMVVLPGGSPAARTQVKLLPAGYDPVKDTAAVPTDTTDNVGNYAFSHVRPGDYTIQAVHLDDRTRTLVSGIHIANDTVAAPVGTLQAPGTIRVYLPGGINSVTGYVYIPGTACFVFLNNHTDFVILDSVPAGVIPAVSYSSISITSTAVIRYDVSVVPGDTTVVYNPSWKYARRLFLNTATGGANVSGDVYNFPVLVRLTAGNFTFAQAQAGGTDIRFTKSDNTFFSFEIERWDVGNKVAELWVKADTVHGNDSAQSLMMYWGNPNAADSSNGPAVFDTAAGFAGVWHLGQPAGAIVPDATANGINGTATATTTASGAIGMAQMFDGTSSFIRASGPATDKLNFQENGAFSVSAWVKATVLDSLCHAIVFKSNLQWGMQIVPENKWEFLDYIDKTGWEISRSPAAAGSWHALTGVRNGTKQYLYLDGVCVDSSFNGSAFNYARAYDQPLDIGHCPDGVNGADNHPDRFFNGIIDEVRISRVALSADWMKLCYMNQKKQDALVKW